jgi:general secretion pathway protein I
MMRSRSYPRVGLSLLEVVLALSILGIAVGILSTIMQQSADNGLRARRMTQAQMVCESKMAEAMAGALQLQSTQWTPVASVDGTSWYYSLEVIPAEQPNMIGVVIQVNDDLAMTESQRPLARLVQWIIDPNLGLDTKPETTTDSATGAAGASAL